MGMKNSVNSILIVIVSLFLTSGCKNQPLEKNTVIQKPPPPPFSHKDQLLYDSIRNEGYSILKKRRFVLFFKDTITDNERSQLFISILKKEFKMDHQKVYDIDYGLSRSFQLYVQPIMDSAITAKYGANGKDSIIKLVIKWTDSLCYLKKRRINSE